MRLHCSCKGPAQKNVTTPSPPVRQTLTNDASIERSKRHRSCLLLAGFPISQKSDESGHGPQARLPFETRVPRGRRRPRVDGVVDASTGAVRAFHHPETATYPGRFPADPGRPSSRLKSILSARALVSSRARTDAAMLRVFTPGYRGKDASRGSRDRSSRSARSRRGSCAGHSTPRAALRWRRRGRSRCGT